MGLFDSIVKVATLGIVDDVTGSKYRQDALNAQGNAAGDVKAYYMPWQNAGQDALKNLQSGDVLQGDTGYQFRMDEGRKALENSAIARGGANSGAAMKALTRFGQGFASNEYNNAYQRTKNLADYGYGATQGLAGNAQGFGNAQAAKSIGDAGAMSNLIGQGLSLGAVALGGMGKAPVSNNPVFANPQQGLNWYELSQQKGMGA